LLGLTIASEIGDIARFPTARKLVGYSGRTPRIKQSGQSSRVGRISKAGPDTLRSAAVEAAQQAWRPNTRGTSSTQTSSAATASPTRRRPPSHARS
jgi:transposase